MSLKKHIAMALPQAELKPDQMQRRMQRSKTIKRGDLVVQYTPYRDAHVHRRVVKTDHSRYWSKIWFEDGGYESYMPHQKVMVDREFAYWEPAAA
jgi:hypothetical protein